MGYENLQFVLHFSLFSLVFRSFGLLRNLFRIAYKTFQILFLAKAVDVGLKQGKTVIVVQVCSFTIFSLDLLSSFLVGLKRMDELILCMFYIAASYISTTLNDWIFNVF